MNQLNTSLTSTLSTLLFLTNQSLNRTISFSSSGGKNTLMRYSQVVYVAVLVSFGVSGNIICAIVFCTKSLR